MMYGPLLNKINNHGLQQRVSENTQMLNAGGLVGFIKDEEGFRTKAYQDPGGVWTIGYGRTTNPDGSRIRPNQATSREAEDSWITKRVDSERSAVRQFAKTHGYDWSDGQVDALASFRYNGGQGMLDMLTKNGTRTNDQIAAKIPQYHKQTMPDGTKKSLPGLVKRRGRELSMFTGEPTQQAEAQVEATANAAPPVPQSTPAVPPPQQEAAQTSLPQDVQSGPSFAGVISAGLESMQPRAIQHQTGRQYTSPEYVPSVVKQPISSQGPQVMTQDPMQPRLPGYNMGGWFSGLFGNEDEQQQLSNALARRPGIRSADPLAGTLPQPQVPTAAPTGVNLSPMGQDMAAMIMPPSDPAAGGQAPGMVPPPMEAPPNMQAAPPLPGSDEAILQGSSDSQASGVMAGWDQLTPDQFMQEAQPKGVTGGGAAPTAPAQGAPITPQDQIDQMAYQSAQEAAALRDNQGITKSLDPATGAPLPGQPTFQDTATPAIDTSAPAPVKKEAVQTKVAEVAKAEPKFVPPEGEASVMQAGKTEMANPEKRKGVMDTLKGFFGDLFNTDELKRAGILYLGAMATGATSGQALAMAGKNYLGRIDSMNASQSKLNNDLVKGGKYTPKSIKSYMQSGDPSDLVSVKAPMTGTGEFKTYYSPNGKQVNAEKVKVGDGQYVWLGENGEHINAKWKTDPSQVQGTQDYSQRVKSDTGQYVDMLKGLRGANARKLDKYGNTEYATGLVPEVAGRDVARWAIDNNVPPELMGEIVQNAYDAAAADSKDGKKVNNLTPYLNDLYVKATVGDADLFRTPSGKAMSADKINNLVGGLTKQAMASGKMGKASEAQVKKQVVQIFQKMWNELDADTKAQYNNQANAGESGFFVFVRKQSLQ